jgi:excisionase family DNA binding protein
MHSHMATDDSKDPRFITVSEAAAELRLSPGSIRRHVRDGHLHAVQLTPGGAFRIPASEIKRLTNPEGASR